MCSPYLHMLLHMIRGRIRLCSGLNHYIILLYQQFMLKYVLLAFHEWGPVCATRERQISCLKLILGKKKLSEHLLWSRKPSDFTPVLQLSTLKYFKPFIMKLIIIGSNYYCFGHSWGTKPSTIYPLWKVIVIQNMDNKWRWLYHHDYHLSEGEFLWRRNVIKATSIIYIHSINHFKKGQLLSNPLSLLNEKVFQ